jgi:hypothetical protein
VVVLPSNLHRITLLPSKHSAAFGHEVGYFDTEVVFYADNVYAGKSATGSIFLLINGYELSGLLGQLRIHIQIGIR